jgi:hypothetical protein
MFLSSCVTSHEVFKHPQAYVLPACCMLHWDGEYPVDMFQRDVPLNTVIVASNGMAFKVIMHPVKKDHILIVTSLSQNERKHIITNAEQNNCTH